MINSGVHWVITISHVVAILLYLCGYFPIKPFISGSTTYSDLPAEPYSDAIPKLSNTDLYSPLVGRTVIVVIDALRADFVFGEEYTGYMSYLQHLLYTGEAKGFVGKAHPPTVTLPRIKALSTGSIPGFVDVFFNLNSSELIEDNLIHQATTNGARIVFYGDDTWIRLFPKHFTRSDGTTSFFVNDFMEVDSNVTRHLSEELARTDWDILILHYLGLDHIGHVLGPKSLLIGRKLHEMDNVIKVVYSALQKEVSSKPPLVVICGDHGMSDAGSHGGASTAETKVPIIFVNQQFKTQTKEHQEEVLQIDVTPTLSMLMGLPIPKNSIGKLISPAFSFLNWRHRLYLAYVNAQHLMHVAQPYIVQQDEIAKNFHQTELRHKEWLKNNCSYELPLKDITNCGDAPALLSAYSAAIDSFRSYVSSESTKYDLYILLLAIVIHWVVLVYIIVNIIIYLVPSEHSSPQHQWLLILMMASLFVLHCLFCWMGVIGESCLCQMSLTALLPVLYIAFVLAKVFYTALTFDRNKFGISWSMHCEINCMYITIWLWGGLIIHSLSLASSSFVEEEHQVWYYFTTSAFFLLLLFCTTSIHLNLLMPLPVFRRESEVIQLKKGPLSIVKPISQVFAVMLLLRLCRSWNYTGDKWAHLPDIGDWLNVSENKLLLTLCFTAGLLLLVILRSQHHNWPATILLVIIALLIYIYRMGTGFLYFPPVFAWFSPTPVVTAKLIYGLLAIFLAANCRTSADDRNHVLHGVPTSWAFLSALLLRPHNMPLLALVVLLEDAVSGLAVKMKLSTISTTLLMMYLSRCSFFLQGNSNSLARIDLAGGYVGLNTYNPTFVALLLLCSTYAGSVFWLLSLCSTLHRQDPIRFEGNLALSSSVLILGRTLPWAFYCIVAYVLRYHLFVWTVFSPKLLYEAATSAVMILIIFYFQVIGHICKKPEKITYFQ